MRPWITKLAALVGGAALGCSSAEVAVVPSPDAGAEVGGAGTYRCDGQHAQELTRGQWVDAGRCALDGGAGSVLHWNGAALGAGSAVLPGEPGTAQHRILAGGRNDTWWLARREDGSTQHALLFHWDGTWWTRLFDWERLAPSGVVSDPLGGAWVFGSRQTSTAPSTSATAATLVHVPPTRDRWEDALPAQIGSGGYVVDMHAARDGTVWAAGLRAADGEGVVVTRIGPVWHDTSFPGGVPTSVWADSAWDAWVTTSAIGVFHWDGVSWKNTWSVRYGTSPGRLAGFGWLTNGFHWDGATWVPPDPTFPATYDVAYLRPFAASLGWPTTPELFGIFGRVTSGGATHSELWSYDGASWRKETSPLAAFVEGAGGDLTALAGTAPDDDLWLAPVTPYAP